MLDIVANNYDEIMELLKMGENQTKVLIITRGAWREDNNSGNTFTNLFEGWDKDKISNIYISPEYPQNNVCEKYFQINDRMLFYNLLKRQKVGKEICFSELNKDEISKAYEKKVDKKVYDFVRIYRFQILFLIRELLWKICKWKNDELAEFIRKTSPDVIFAPLYDSHYTHNLTSYVARVTGKKIATLISDDIYTYKQFSLSPIYWINRYFLRRNIRKSIQKCGLIYIMAPKHKEEYDSILNIQSYILYKGGNFQDRPIIREQCNKPIKIVYAGNIFAGRWKTLAKIAKALENINSDDCKAQLFIYTQNPMSVKMEKALKIDKSSFLMGGLPFNEVKKVLADADVVVHAESFGIKNRLLTRLSFSTKIVDYFESGRCILAVGSTDAASIDYLSKNNAAVIVGSGNDIEKSLRKLVDNPQLIIDYGMRAWECGRENHQMMEIRNRLKRDLTLLAYQS